MPIICRGTLEIDYTEQGRGETVVLIHSSGSGNRQWRTLAEALKDRYRVLAPNLFGYGKTPPWRHDSPLTLADQAELVLALCPDEPGAVHLVGHSFGGAVALKAAAMLGRRVGKLVLFEPIPFQLLLQHGRQEAYQEALALCNHMKHFGTRGDWSIAAERFADYWLGDGAWGTMSEKRRTAFTTSLAPLLNEFDAVMDETSTIEACKGLSARTLVISDREARRTIRDVVEILRQACPAWTFSQISGCGHMAPLTCPAVVNPLVRQFLDER